jgi:hypothetical protein
MVHNAELKDGYFDLPGDDPAGTPITVTMAMANNGMLTVTASHPRVPEPLVFTADGGKSVLSEEAVAESKARVQALRRKA